MTPYLWLLPVGMLIGAFGTLIGAGGRFVLPPYRTNLPPAPMTREKAATASASAI